MRKKDCIFSMAKERDEDLMRVYHEQMDIAMRSKSEIKQLEVVANAINSPASRYWISLERACAIVYKIRKGNKLEGIKGNTRKLYYSLYNEYLSAQKENPDIPVKHLVAEVIEKQAPCFALTTQSANLLINRIKKKQWYIERRRLLRHLF